MKPNDYKATIQVKASAKKAFNNINRVDAWWSENIDGSTDKLNDVFTIHFGDTFVKMKIVEFVPEKKVVWSVTDCYLHWLADKKEWKNTRIVFEVSPEGDSSEIQFTHIGLTPQVECYEGCVKGWDEYIKDSLVKQINEGKGLPQKKTKPVAELVK